MKDFTNIIGIAALAVIVAIGFSLNACEEKEKASKPTEAAVPQETPEPVAEEEESEPCLTESERSKMSLAEAIVGEWVSFESDGSRQDKPTRFDKCSESDGVCYGNYMTLHGDYFHYAIKGGLIFRGTEPVEVSDLTLAETLEIKGYKMTWIDKSNNKRMEWVHYKCGDKK